MIDNNEPLELEVFLELSDLSTLSITAPSTLLSALRHRLDEFLEARREGPIAIDGYAKDLDELTRDMLLLASPEPSPRALSIRDSDDPYDPLRCKKRLNPRKE